MWTCDGLLHRVPTLAVMNIGEPVRTVELPDEEPMHFPEREPERIEPVKVPENVPEGAPAPVR